MPLPSKTLLDLFQIYCTPRSAFLNPSLYSEFMPKSFSPFSRRLKQTWIIGQQRNEKFWEAIVSSSKDFFYASLFWCVQERDYSRLCLMATRPAGHWSLRSKIQNDRTWWIRLRQCHHAGVCTAVRPSIHPCVTVRLHKQIFTSWAWCLWLWKPYKMKPADRGGCGGANHTCQLYCYIKMNGPTPWLQQRNALRVALGNCPFWSNDTHRWKNWQRHTFVESIFFCLAWFFLRKIWAVVMNGWFKKSQGLLYSWRSTHFYCWCIIMI